MTESGSEPSVIGHVLRVGALGALVLGVAACSGSSASSGNSAAPTTAVPSTSALGPRARATGTPVKVGYITDGSNGSESGSQYEEAVAKATEPWLNEHMNGLGGHPIELDICVDDLEPGKAIDCANQLIRDNVVAVVIGASGAIESSWKILHDAHVPVVTNAVTTTALLADSASTFIVNDPIAQVVNAPVAVAKEEGAKRVSVVVIDLPIATDIYKGSTPDLYKHNGLDLKVVPVAVGTADMTPQAQQIVAANPDGLVSVVGYDQFCIAALNALRSVGFHGSRFMILQCLTDATRKALPGDVLKGIMTVSVAPLGDNSDPSMQQYAAVIDKYATSKIDPSDLIGLMTFQSLAAVSVGTQSLSGAVTPASVTATLKAMKNSVLPGSGDRHFRCNGKASPDRPAVCSVSVLTSTLDGKGYPAKYTVANDEPIGG